MYKMLIIHIFMLQYLSEYYMMGFVLSIRDIRSVQFSHSTEQNKALFSCGEKGETDRKPVSKYINKYCDEIYSKVRGE